MTRRAYVIRKRAKPRPWPVLAFLACTLPVVASAFLSGAGPAFLIRVVPVFGLFLIGLLIGVAAIMRRERPKWMGYMGLAANLIAMAVWARYLPAGMIALSGTFGRGR